MSPTDPAGPPADASATTAEQPLRSVHTGSFPPLLRQLGASLLVTTYQAGKLVVVRADGEVINTHFRVFPRPMGLAARRERFAIGTQRQVEEFRNMAAVAAKLEPAGKHDAAFLPRRSHVTGDIDIHEMDYADDGQLWFINTRFSCLCTLDAEHSFVPHWRPPFISAYAPSDRCHLNGLALRDGRPRYVTALGTADTEQGWRARKADGGVLMDLDSNAVLLEGLSMPHSPRWYQDRLWVLESGRGGIGWLDPDGGRLNTLTTLPGFTRGLDFAGPFAFVGVSQVRESATFSGIPLTRTLKERNCGVWVVDLRNGQIVAFLRFEAAVQEIFAVSVLPGIRFPDVINHDATLMGLSYALPDAALKDAAMPTPRPRAQPHQDKGVAHHQAGELEAAAAAFREALAVQPDFLPARYNLGVTLNDLEHFAEAIAELEQVVADEASHADAHRALGFAHSQLRDIEAAIHHLRQAISIRPDFAEAHLNLGMLLLMQGHYAEGWRAFDWRWKTAGFTPFDPQSHPRWDGAPLPAGTLLIHTEQGAGDAIQCLRFLPTVAARCEQLLVVAPPALHPLIEGLAANLTVIPPGPLAADAFVAYLPIMSLPRVLGVNAEAEIPNQTPYLQADPTRLTLPRVGGRRRIGLVWAGSPTFSNDRHRSIALETLAPLIEASGDDTLWCSLQKGEAAQQRATLAVADRLHDLDPLLRDYGDTAAALSQLDLLISVDTSVAHLAGALGVPTWLLLPFNADWRWGLERTDSPWYPSLRLFRQRRLGDWTPVIKAMAEALARGISSTSLVRERRSRA
ncbi:TIGR03032 family protein [uncultured Thiohalocapsa sp.]|uniref:TIGR03032 family protein n=1 Tax=uncultured Thiohalocapsa sp. TaxID=768990 RepID=UPI0025D65EF8|nr:TIGR03032 family protein [uncultured Thiohalocapsa sp.]